MVTHSSTPGRLYGEMSVDKARESGTSLIVMHAHQSRASHVLVIDPDLYESDRTGGLLGARGFKVTLSSAWLDLESLAYLAADLLVVRPPAGQSARREAHVRAVAVDSCLRDMPVIWIASPEQRTPAMAIRLAHILTCPWTPFELLTLVESLLAATNGSELTPRDVSAPGPPLANSYSAIPAGSD